MNHSPALPVYDTLAHTLAQHEPAEFHGLLCGLLCVDSGLTADTWLATVDQESGRTAAVTAEMRQLYSATLNQLDSTEFGFHLLLPDDDRILGERAVALGAWCQGFLSGLGLGGLESTADLSPEVGEFIQDVSQIARIGFDTYDGDEGDETAYAEIVEYLRVGVLLVRQALSPKPATTGQRLH